MLDQLGGFYTVFDQYSTKPCQVSLNYLNFFLSLLGWSWNSWLMNKGSVLVCWWGNIFYSTSRATLVQNTIKYKKKLMAFKVKLCDLIFEKQIKVFEHYRLHHSNVSSVSPLPCPYDFCICTFQSLNALKIHLTWIHSHKVL